MPATASSLPDSRTDARARQSDLFEQSNSLVRQVELLPLVTVAGHAA
jgi:hypothetical protein